MNEIKLLKVLENNARLSDEDIAAMLNEPVEDVKETVRKLENSGTIAGYHAVIDYDKTDVQTVTAVIEVGATPRKDTGYDGIAAEIYQHPEVSTMYLMSGKSEFLVFLKGKTMREVAEFVAKHLSPIEGVTDTETHFVLMPYKVEGNVVNKKLEKESDIQLVTP